MTDERKPKGIVELRDRFLRVTEPTAEEAAEIWRRIAAAQDAEDRRARELEQQGRWSIEHAGAPAVPAKFSVRDVPIVVVCLLAFGFVLFVLCGGAP